ncbi:glycosyltransferase family 4 protein [Carnobacterium funditum]|uniref:glycosyltransferase family 4 protein n=1 Tax=Carnobacterium funditum TaxID=2752 RepID=UPI0005573A3D|nr:glycosyltransferase family 4 protein [Carnobacterium funditum]
MNILHLNSNFENSTIHYNIVNELNNYPGVSGSLFYPDKLNSTYRGNEINFLVHKKCLIKFENFFFSIRNEHLLNVIKKNLVLESFSTTLAHSLFSNGYLAYTLMKKKGIPYSVIVTNTDMNIYFKKMKHLRSKGIKILLNSKKIIFSSVTYRDELINKYIDDNLKAEILKKSIVIPFGIDNFWIENKVKTPKKISSESLKLLYVGKINKNKNIELTIEACKILISKGTRIELTIVGDIVKQKDEKLKQNILNNDFVNYVSHTKFENLIEIYRLNDIFIMPSKVESFGLVYAEAMSQGLPVIYTRNQGFDKQFEEKEIGVSVDSNSVRDVVKGIEYIKDNYQKLSESTYKKVDKFSWRKVVEMFVKEIS